MNSSFIVAFEFSRDGDDFGWLTAEVQTPRFRGSNGMWVQWQDVSDLAEALRAHPIKQNDPVTADWGFGEASQGKAVATTITGLSIEPRGKTGRGWSHGYALQTTINQPIDAAPNQRLTIILLHSLQMRSPGYCGRGPAVLRCTAMQTSANSHKRPHGLRPIANIHRREDHGG